MVSLPHESRTRRIIDGAASSAGHTLQHVATVTQFATMISFVRAGVGIAIVPSSAIAGLLGKDLAVLTLTKPRLSRDVGLIWLRERELTRSPEDLRSSSKRCGATRLIDAKMAIIIDIGFSLHRYSS
jgi:DNA-binding transcriptional LysR family regulator